MAKYVMRSTVIVPKAVIELEQGQTVAKGTAVDLPKSYGDHLVAEKLALTASGQPETAVEIDEVRMEIVAAVIAGLQSDQFTGGGLPEVNAINAGLPEGTDPVTAGERNAIWKALQEAERE